MGHNKHCSAELRSIVQGLRKEGKSLRAIAKINSFSLGMVVNTLEEKRMKKHVVENAKHHPTLTYALFDAEKIIRLQLRQRSKPT